MLSWLLTRNRVRDKVRPARGDDEHPPQVNARQLVDASGQADRGETNRRQHQRNSQDRRDDDDYQAAAPEREIGMKSIRSAREDYSWRPSILAGSYPTIKPC